VVREYLVHGYVLGEWRENQISDDGKVGWTEEQLPPVISSERKVGRKRCN
jgi:hypothetical protein